MAKHLLPLRGATSSGKTVNIREVELGSLTQIAGWEDFASAAGKKLASVALTLPDSYRLPARLSGTTVWRIAPDRALVRSDVPLISFDSPDIVTLDLSDARVRLELAGAGAVDLFSRVIAVDFSATAFPVGTFAQTSLHHVGVLVDRVGDEKFELLIPTTWATSIVGILADHLHAPAGA